MKRMSQADYRLNGGHICPFCKNDTTDQIANSVYFLEVGRECVDCGKAWTEEHKIKGYKEIKNYVKEII